MTASTPTRLLKYADTAMYRAKEAGRDTYRFFTAAMNVQAMAKLDLEHALRKALENEEFVLHYQPKIEIPTGNIVGVEALLRWNRPGHGLVYPGDFIPLLEETGLIARVGSWVIATACKQIAAWERNGLGAVHVSVNVSAMQFFEGSLESDLLRAIGSNEIDAGLLELELTETSLMSNVEGTIAALDNLKKLGIRISIDDFGTGYSSLAYLKRFPIDTIKIDRAFIRDVTTDPDDAAIVLAIINMAHSLKLNVIAEGVETEEQLSYLRRHGCNQIQGYYFSKPVPAAMLEQIIERENKLALQAAASVFDPGSLGAIEIV
jgi:EAL domain-containing protein (putative c-di-GMP-specific phosphodiesterase class I)